MRVSFSSLIVLVSGMFLGACASGVEQTVLPTEVSYRCAGGKLLQVLRAADAREASFVLDGRRVTLPRADSAAQEKYAAGGLALYLEGERAVVEESGRVLYGPCQSSAPLPTAPRRAY